jgi:hypothetical protein
MQKLFITLLSAITIVNFVNAQDSDFKPSGNLSGYVFGDYYYMGHADSLGRGAGNVQYKPYSTTSTLLIPSTGTPVLGYKGNDSIVKLGSANKNLLGSGLQNKAKSNAFQIRRVYISYDYNFAPKFTASATLADEQNLDAGGNNTVYLKYAYLKWADIFPMINLIIGQQPTPSFATTPFGTEPLWGYRSIERTIMDIHNIDASSDLGVALQGDVWRGFSGDSLKPNLVGYMLQIGNGSSAKPENDGYKTMRYTIYSSLMQQKLTFGFYGDYKTTALGTVNQSATTFKGYANFKTKKFKIGGEIFFQNWKNGATLSTNAYQDINIMGWSVFTSGKIIQDLNFFARLDMFNPDTKYNKNDIYTKVAPASIIQPSWSSPTSATLTPYTLANDAISQSAIFSTQTFVTAGFDYTPVKRFHIMPNIWYTQFNSMVNLPSTAKLAKSDYDLVYRVTFYYIFNSSKSVNNNGMDN